MHWLKQSQRKSRKKPEASVRDSNPNGYKLSSVHLTCNSGEASVGRASHRYRGGHLGSNLWSLRIFFWAFFVTALVASQLWGSVFISILYPQCTHVIFQYHIHIMSFSSYNGYTLNSHFDLLPTRLHSSAVASIALVYRRGHGFDLRIFFWALPLRGSLSLVLFFLYDLYHIHIISI